MTAQPHPQTQAQTQTQPPTPKTTDPHPTDIVEVEYRARSGALGIGLIVLGIILFAGGIVLAATHGQSGLWNGIGGGICAIGCVLAVLTFPALVIVQPGDTKVLTFFGRYIGTVRRAGLSTVRPFSVHKRLTVRVRNFETAELKVNDAQGNPVDIAAIIVWKVTDTAKATFAVDNYDTFVTVQSEAALRHITGAYPYDGPDDPARPTLRGAPEAVSGRLAAEVTERVAVAGVDIVEARISKLAYAPEIAQAMLQRQQAGAIIAARQTIVEGAVGIVNDALARLEDEHVVVLDDERRAAMVSNLLVVLAGDSRATPVVNTGSLYA
ncbi:MAG: SPFH domain-containing protein [Bifidobacteriaceae bacterium]|jgi:regulator of protease activity HflC (stomatin/prohibitin superfamily)|nr:SPFH domain-containing protein [Bifidobacteriaceae bacterium]